MAISGIYGVDRKAMTDWNRQKVLDIRNNSYRPLWRLGSMISRHGLHDRLIHRSGD
jgi:hypothetical protein